MFSSTSQSKILILGPSGVGKSSLCNAIFNQRVDIESIRKPASVAATAVGVTSEIYNYVADHTLVLTDTIGFDDCRKDPVVIANEVRRMIKVSDIGYEKVILCLRHGRVSKAARVYLRLLSAMFEDPCSNMILYISGCEDGTTVDEFVEENNDAGKDKEIGELIEMMLKQREKNRKNGIEIETIITGSMAYHKKGDDEDAKMYLPERKRTLNAIMKSINTDIGVARVRSAELLWSRLQEFLLWLFNSYNNPILNVVSGAVSMSVTSVQLAMMWVGDNVKVKYHYGTCAICLSDEQDIEWIITPCTHRFHRACVERLPNEPPDIWTGSLDVKRCPICREVVKYSDLVDLP